MASPVRAAASAFQRQRTWFIIFMLLPTTILLLGLTVFPFIASLIFSFTDYSLIAPDDTVTVWLDNYGDLLSSADFWNAFKVTVVFTLVAVAIQTALGVGVAVLLHNETRGVPILRAIYLLPLAVTPVAATFTFRMMFNPTLGVFNYFFRELGLPPQAWLSDAALALPTLILVDTWQWTPFILLIAAGGLASIPEEPFEAAKIDGCGAWQSFVHLTLPMLKPFILLAVLFRSIDAFKTFDIIFVLTGGGPGVVTRTLNLFAYKHGIEFLSMGYAGAIAIIMLIMTILFAQAFLRRSRLLRPRID